MRKDFISTLLMALAVTSNATTFVSAQEAAMPAPDVAASDLAAPDLAAPDLAAPEPQSASAITAMADQYFSGPGAARDDEKAFALYQKAAGMGHAPAQFRLGYMYAAGRGVAADEAAAADWYRKAIAQSYVPAMTNLGVMYYEGRGVARDPQLGLDLLQRAARAGDKRASDYLVEIGVRR